MAHPSQALLTLIILLSIAIGSCQSDRKTPPTPPTDPTTSAQPENQIKPDTFVVRDTIVIRDTVGQTRPQAMVTADKMNVLYMGVDNPITIAASGIDPASLQVQGSGSGIQLKKVGSSKYMATVSKPEEARITVMADGLRLATRFFRAKRVPDPIARLSNSSGGIMGTGEFKAQGGVGAFLDNFDFDATCAISGFNLVYVPKRQDPIEVVNLGARYNSESRRLVNLAKPGDLYCFQNIKAKCPGDAASRNINTMVFQIK